jgi:hypothetical protein
LTYNKRLRKLSFSPQLHVPHGFVALSPHKKISCPNRYGFGQEIDILHILAQLLIKRSLYLLLIAACAAASLAIGTRNGEHDT